MNIIKQSEVLTIIKPYISETPTIVEVGAFIGHDTIRMAQTFPMGTLYAFEPVPELYAQLCTHTKQYANIKTYPYAISNKDGMQPFYVTQKSSGTITQASALQKPKERLRYSSIQFPTKIMVQTMTLSAWCNNEHITTIDLLWLDTQGHEMAILKSSQPLLPHIKAIYTEVGFIEAYEGQSDANIIIEWLSNAGFTAIAQDFTNPPTWFFGNILFVRTDLLD